VARSAAAKTFWLDFVSGSSSRINVHWDGVTRVGVVWAKQVGRRFAGGKFLRAGAGGGAVVLGCGAAKWVERKAALAALFWSKQIAASY